ncbi:MAG: copper resistance CopC/CopD family protein [Acidimicrobiales bacterium]
MTRRLARRAAAGALALAAALTVALAMTASPAAAHAVLESSSPSDQARLDTPPSEVVLVFNEPLSATPGAVRVFDAEARRADRGELVVVDGTVTVPLRPELANGPFVVTWRVVSADSHTVRGAFTFTIGEGPAADSSFVASLFDEGRTRPWEVMAAVLRLTAYGGVLVAGGVAVFLVLVHDGRDRRSDLVRTIRLAAVAGGVAVLAGLVVQALVVTGADLALAFTGDVVATVLRNGVAAATVLALVGLVLVVVGSRARPGRRATVITVVGAAVAVASFAAAGHSSTTSPQLVARTADVVHLLAGAVWFGGLIGLVVTLRRRPAVDDVGSTAGIVARFSTLAAVALVAVSAAGLTLAWSEVRATRALTSTTYGWLLVVKATAVAAVVVVAGYNRYRLVPAITQHRSKTGATTAGPAWARLRGTVRAEAAVLVGVLAVTAVLVNVVPARTAAGVTGPFSATVDFGDGSVSLVVDPARAGANDVHLYVLDATGRPIGEVEEIRLELSFPAEGVGPIIRTPVPSGPGHWVLTGDDLTLPGRWEVEVVARLSPFEEATATVDVPVNP